MTVDVNGYATGLKSFNDGHTGSLRITADQVLIASGDLFDDPFFDNSAQWTSTPNTWQFEDGVGGCTPDRLNVRRCATLWSGSYSTLGVPAYIYTHERNLTCCPDEWIRFGAKGRNGSNHHIVLVVQFFDASVVYVDQVTLTFLAGETAGYKSVLYKVPTAARLSRVLVVNDINTTPGVAFSGVAEISDIRVVRATGSNLTVAGSIGAREINAEYTNTTVLQAKQAVIDYAAINSLSAISANLGQITAATMELTGAGWSYIRTNSKWLQDGVNGWISASRGDNNSFFQEFRASNGNALVYELKAGGPDMGGVYYRLQVRDAAGVDRLVIDPQTGTYKYGGTLQAASGTFGVVTAGYLQNANNTASLDLNASGSAPFLRAGWRDLILANGKTQFQNEIWSQWVTVNKTLYGEIIRHDGDGYPFTTVEYLGPQVIEFDLGANYDVSALGTQTFTVRVWGYTASWGDKASLRIGVTGVVRCLLPAASSGAWTTCRLICKLEVALFNNDGTVIAPGAVIGDSEFIVNQFGIAIAGIS
jgi:hypothetical protein